VFPTPLLCNNLLYRIMWRSPSYCCRVPNVYQAMNGVYSTFCHDRAVGGRALAPGAIVRLQERNIPSLQLSTELATESRYSRQVLSHFVKLNTPQSFLRRPLYGILLVAVGR
jgi:hypothetical protein